MSLCALGYARNIACVGDSITRGQHAAGSYPARLSALLPDAPTVTNLGVNSATVTSYASTAQHASLLSRAWDVVVIMFGTNEVLSHPGQLGSACATNLACTYATEYGKLVGSIRAVSARTTIFTVIPPQTYGTYPETDVLRELVPAIAQTHGLPPPIDLYTALDGTDATPRCMLTTSTPAGCRFFCDAQQCDQLHPVARGYEAIAAAVAHHVPPQLLCLHGGGQTAAGLEAMVKQTMGSAYQDYRFVYVTAPHSGLWLRDPPGGKAVPTTSSAWDAPALAALDAAVHAHGPFYGIVGYSQGAAMALAYLAHAPAHTFQTALFFCGYVPTTHEGVTARIKSASPLPVRALVYAGLQDTVIAPCLTMASAQHVADVTYAISPQGGHAPPAAGTAAGEAVAHFLAGKTAALDAHPPPACNAAASARPAPHFWAMMAMAAWALVR